MLMSLEDFASYEETAHLLRSPRNAERLMESIAELDAGKGEARTHVE
jgi:antitoxin YefM